MRTKLLALAATGVAGLALGAGVGVAAAQSDGRDTARPPVTTPATELDSMDEMHAAMRDQIPAELAAQCEEMHASMPAEMRSMEPGVMGSMMGGMGDSMGAGSMAARHAQHHG